MRTGLHRPRRAGNILIVLIGIALFAALLAMAWGPVAHAQTRAEWEAIRARTGVTPENACLLLALNLTPCDDDEPAPRAKVPASEQGWGSAKPRHYDLSPR